MGFLANVFLKNKEDQLQKSQTQIGFFFVPNFFSDMCQKKKIGTKKNERVRKKIALLWSHIVGLAMCHGSGVTHVS